MCTYVSLSLTVKSFITNCKSDDSTCKFHQPLQSRLTAIQLTVTRGGVLGEGAIENVTPVFDPLYWFKI